MKRIKIQTIILNLMIKIYFYGFNNCLVLN